MFKINGSYNGSNALFFRVNDEIHSQISKLACENHINMSELIRQMVIYCLEHRDDLTLP